MQCTGIGLKNGNMSRNASKEDRDARYGLNCIFHNGHSQAIQKIVL